MGLSLMLSLFRDVPADEVFRALTEFYVALGRPPMPLEEAPEHEVTTVYARDAGWVVVDHRYIWWEWDEQLQVHEGISADHQCIALLAFVSDGDYWGYQLHNGGRKIDQFQQDPHPDDGWTRFPRGSTRGDAEAVARTLGFVSPSDVSPYLVQKPDIHSFADAGGAWQRGYSEARNSLDVPARTGDQHTRFDQCALLDFLRLLQVRVELIEQRVTFRAPEFGRIWVKVDRNERRRRMRRNADQP